MSIHPLTFRGQEPPQGARLTNIMVSSPAVSIRALDPPGTRGRIRTGGKLGNRSVQLRFVISGQDAVSRAGIAARLNAWAWSDAPGELALPGFGDRVLMAECDGYAAPSEGNPEAELEMSFMASRPEYVAIRESSQDISGTINIGGGLPTPICIRQTLAAAVTGPIWLIDATAHTISVTGEVPAGALVIDTEHGTITIDGDDISDQVTLTSDLIFELSPGNHQIAGSNGAGGVAYWRNRWL